MQELKRLICLAGVCGLAVLSGCVTPESPTGAGNTDAADARQVGILLGAAAKRLCSSVFVSGRSRDHVLAHELNSASAAEINFLVSGDVVKASLGEATATALHREGLGCTLIKDIPVETLRLQYDRTRYPAVSAPALPWPLGSEVTLPTSVDGIDQDAVKRAINSAFDDIEEGQDIQTRAALVVFRGQIIAEKYGEGFDATMPQLGWSMTKTVTNLLTGMLVGDGVLAVNAPAPVPLWQAKGDPRGSITLHNLLQMSSGLAFSEVYTAGSMSDVILMLYDTGATGSFAAAKPLEHAPDSHWSYSSGTTNIISMILRSRFASQQSYFNFPRERLFNPLGMASAVIEPDAAGVFVGSSYMYATPRDWAKIGLLLLQDGVWNGQRLLPAGWVDYTLTPANAAPRGRYGAQIWLNAGTAADPADLPDETLPPSTYYLSGFEGQNVVVIPEHELIVVRMGLTSRGPSPVWNLVRDVLDALQ
ncbi:MAG: serine hydrolase domain-containing protein [Pseudomonadota bacterium]